MILQVHLHNENTANILIISSVKGCCNHKQEIVLVAEKYQSDVILPHSFHQPSTPYTVNHASLNTLDLV